MSQSPKTKKIIIDIGHTLHGESPKAVCLEVNGKKIWFPKNSIYYSLEKGKMELPYWMALKNDCLPAPQPQRNLPQPQRNLPQPQRNLPQPQRNLPAPQSGIARKPLIEEFTKLYNEVQQMNQRLETIQRELSKDHYATSNYKTNR